VHVTVDLSHPTSVPVAARLDNSAKGLPRRERAAPSAHIEFDLVTAGRGAHAGRVKVTAPAGSRLGNAGPVRPPNGPIAVMLVNVPIAARGDVTRSSTGMLELSPVGQMNVPTTMTAFACLPWSGTHS
jgi:hypothetical protein